MSPIASLRSIVPVAVIAVAAAAASANVYTVDYFPESLQTNGISQLRFVPSFVRPDFVGGTITNTRLVVSFTTGNLAMGGPFEAEDLTLLIAGNVPDSPVGYWLVTGADLGWSGHGTFTADVSTTNFNGTVAPGAWQWDLSGLVGAEDIARYAGSFSADSRLEITYTPNPAYCAADANSSGDVSVQDIFDFLAAYFSDDLRTADINRSGDLSVQDIFDFLAIYFAGCF